MSKRIPDFTFIVFVLLISIAGFWDLYFGEDAHANGYHHLHVISSFTWLILIGVQLLLINRNNRIMHRRLGYSIFLMGPFVIASLMLLTVYSASRAEASNTIDPLAIQNVGVTLEVGIIILLAFIFKNKVKLHGAFILSSALMFMAIALFFSLLTFIPYFEITGPDSFENFGKASMTALVIISVIGLIMFFRDIKNGWPWLITLFFLYLNSVLTIWLDGSGGLQQLTDFVGVFSQPYTFVIAFFVFLILLILAWKAPRIKLAAVLK